MGGRGVNGLAAAVGGTCDVNLARDDAGSGSVRGSTPLGGATGRADGGKRAVNWRITASAWSSGSLKRADGSLASGLSGASADRPGAGCGAVSRAGDLAEGGSAALRGFSDDSIGGGGAGTMATGIADEASWADDQRG